MKSTKSIQTPPINAVIDGHCCHVAIFLRFPHHRALPSLAFASFLLVFATGTSRPSHPKTQIHTFWPSSPQNSITPAASSIIKPCYQAVLCLELKSCSSSLKPLEAPQVTPRYLKPSSCLFANGSNIWNTSIPSQSTNWLSFHCGM
jgi:hypothetical protein